MRIPHSVTGRVRPNRPNIRAPGSPSPVGMPDLPSLPYLSSRASPSAFGAQAGRALGGFGEALAAVAVDLEQNRQQESRIEANGRLASFELQRNEHLEVLNRDSDSFSNIDHEFSQRFFEDADRIIEEAPDEATKEYLQNQLINTYRSYQLKAQGLERARNEKSVNFKLNSQFDEARNIVRSDPARLDEQVERLTVALSEAEGVLPRQDIEERVRLFLQGTVESSIRGRIEQNPEQVMDELHSGATKSGSEAALLYRESGGNPSAFNQLGFAGLYQFGAPRLAHIGVYKPGAGENLKNWNETSGQAEGKWSGRFEIPGHPQVKTLTDFLASPAAQHTAFLLHKRKMDAEIIDNGFDEYIGERVQGVLITREGLHNMMHLGGVGGTRQVLTGKGNPQDENGTSVLDYARMGSKVIQAAGGTDAILKPEQKEQLLALAEAEINKRLADAEKLDKQRTEDLKQLQERVTSQFHVGIARGEVEMPMLVQALEQGHIDSAQFRQLRTDLTAEPPDVGDPEAALQLRPQVLTGEVSIPEVMERRDLSVDQRRELVDLADTVQRRAGAMARGDVEFEQQRLDRVIGGVRGPLSVLDTGASERLNNAMTEFFDFVNTNPEVQAPQLREFTDDLIERYRQEPANLQSLPHIPYWSGPLHGPKETLRLSWANAYRRVLEDHEAGTISEERYIQLMRDFERYREVIEAQER